MQPNTSVCRTSTAGFTLIELLIAMSIALTVLGLASVLLASSFHIRSREDRRSQAIADVQRGLNLMTREIANTGFRVPSGLTYTTAAGPQAGVPVNGIVPSDSGADSLRILSNLNDTGATTTGGGSVVGTANESEDIQFSLYNDVANNNRFLVRHDANLAAADNPTTVLANRIDAMSFSYFAGRVNYTTSADLTNCDITPEAGATELNVATQGAQVRYVVASVCVKLDKVGTEGQPGFQPESRVQLVSDVLLRNADLSGY